MIDWDKFNEFLPYDKPIVLDLIDMFITSYPQNIAELRKNIAQRDFPELDINAHSLKSNCAMFGGTEAAKLALQLEMMGKTCSSEDINGVFDQFVAVTGILVQELNQYRNTLLSS